MKVNLKKLTILTAVFAIASQSLVFAQAVRIEDGKKVKFDYTLKVDGQVVDTSEKEGRQPMEYTHGEPRIIPGLEKELKGMKAGDTKRVIVEPAEAYGELDQKGFKIVPLDQFPPDFKAEVGRVIAVKTEEGRDIASTIWEVRENELVLNFNHPLAGKTLNFDIKIVSVE